MVNEVKGLIDKWIQKKLSGKITINFFKGGITSWKVEETFKPNKKKLTNFDNRVTESFKGRMA